MSNLILPKPVDFERKTLPYDKMRRLAAAADVIEEMGYGLVCPSCSRLYGLGKDSVVANNEPGSDRLEIRCGCTIWSTAARRN